MCALVTWVTEHVLLMLTMQLNAQVFMMQINLIDCDILSGFELTLSGDNPKGVASQG